MNKGKAISYYFICLWVLSGILPCAHGQNMTVQNKKGDLLPYVQVLQKKHQISFLTDTLGHLSLNQFALHEPLEFRLMGYERVILTLAEIEKLDYLVTLSSSEQFLQELVVSGSRWEQNSIEIPAKIATISSAEINFRNPQTSADLLEISDHVYVQKSQMGGGSPMIRGFASNRLLIVVDGIRMNNAIFRSGNVQNVISIDPQAIEQTEILFGPGSVLYGSDAIGGVMDFHTYSPKFSPHFMIDGLTSTRYSSANSERTIHADIQLAAKKWSSITSVSSSQFGNLMAGIHGPKEFLRDSFQTNINGVDTVLINSNPREQIETAYAQVNILQKLAFQPNADHMIQYAFHYSKISDVPRYDRLTEKRNGRFRNAEWYYGPQIWQMHQLKWEHQGAGSLYDHLKVNLAYQFFEESRNDRSFGAIRLKKRKEMVHAYLGNIDFDKKLSEQVDLFYGGEYWLNQVRSSGISVNILNKEETAIQPRYPDQSEMHSYGLYSLLKWKLSSKWISNFAVRFSHYSINASLNSTFLNLPLTRANLSNGAINGSMGWVYLPLPTLKIYSNLSTGFRAPNIDDIGKVFDSEPGIVIVPNTELRPEYAYNFDIGTSFNMGNQLKMDFSFFYSYLDHALARRDFQLDGEDSVFYDGQLSKVEAIQNIAYAEVYGMQASAVWDLKPFKISAAYNWQNGLETDEVTDFQVPLRHIPPIYGNFHFIYAIHELKLDLYTNFNGKISYANLAPSERNKAYIYAIDSDGNPYAPAWHTLNFKGQIKIADDFNMQFGIENITNRLYRTYSSGISAAGRNYIIGLTWGF